MSQNNGSASTSEALASRLRGNGASLQEQEGMGSHMRADQDKEGVAGPTDTPRDQVHRGVPAEARQGLEAPTSPAESVNWNSGHIEPARPKEVERWILEGLQKRSRWRGRSHIPEDLFDFSAKATITFLDAENRPVHFVRAVATWEDDS